MAYCGLMTVAEFLRFIAEMRYTFDAALNPSDPTPRQVPLDDKAGEDSVVKGVVTKFKHDLDVSRGATTLADSTLAPIPEAVGV